MSFVLLFFSVNADAQESAIAAIRSHYQKTQARIQKLATEEGKSEGLYLYLISDNYHEGSWPGVGYFKYEEKYYYELGDNQEKKSSKYPYPQLMPHGFTMKSIFSTIRGN